jgi:hypothetical protein
MEYMELQLPQSSALSSGLGGSQCLLVAHRPRSNHSATPDLTEIKRTWPRDISPVYVPCPNFFQLKPAILWKPYVFPYVSQYFFNLTYSLILISFPSISFYFPVHSPFIPHSFHHVFPCFPSKTCPNSAPQSPRSADVPRHLWPCCSMPSGTGPACPGRRPDMRQISVSWHIYVNSV